MKKAITILVMCFVVCSSFAFAQITTRSDEIFPTISIVPPIAHFAGDDAPVVVQLYAMQNANHYLDAYKALVTYHNQTMIEAQAVSDVNGKLSDELKAKELDILWTGTKWAVIGAVVGGAVVGVICLARK